MNMNFNCRFFVLSALSRGSFEREYSYFKVYWGFFVPTGDTTTNTCLKVMSSDCCLSTHFLFLLRFKGPFFEKGQTRSPQQLAEGYWALRKPVAGAQHTHTRYFLTAGLETGSCQHGNERKSVIFVYEQNQSYFLILRGTPSCCASWHHNSCTNICAHI